jgi:hypothetical protein
MVPPLSARGVIHHKTVSMEVLDHVGLVFPLCHLDVFFLTELEDADSSIFVDYYQVWPLIDGDT